jgi:hypothetical protein
MRTLTTVTTWPVPLRIARCSTAQSGAILREGLEQRDIQVDAP